MTPQDTQQLLDKRGSSYGDAWKLTGALLGIVASWPGSLDTPPFKHLMQLGYGYNWIEMLGKLCRMLFSPNDVDHWKDIAGYAELVVREMEGSTEPSTDDNIPF